MKKFILFFTLLSVNSLADNFCEKEANKIRSSIDSDYNDIISHAKKQIDYGNGAGTYAGDINGDGKIEIITYLEIYEKYSHIANTKKARINEQESNGWSNSQSRRNSYWFSC